MYLKSNGCLSPFLTFDDGKLMLFDFTRLLLLSTLHHLHRGSSTNLEPSCGHMSAREDVCSIIYLSVPKRT